MGVETALAIGIPLAIGAIGTMVQSGNRGDITQAGEQKLRNMQSAGQSYGAYRPQAADARMKAMQQQLSAFQGAGNIMQSMYGGSGGPTGGTFTPGSGGWKPGDPGFDPRSPDPNNAGWPKKIGGMTFNSQAEYDAWFKANQDRNAQIRDYENQMGVPKGTPVSPPIYVPREGIGAGSSGTSLMGPMAESLAGPPAPAGLNPMVAGLALPKRGV